MNKNLFIFKRFRHADFQNNLCRCSFRRIINNKQLFKVSVSLVIINTKDLNLGFEQLTKRLFLPHTLLTFGHLVIFGQIVKFYVALKTISKCSL